MGRTAKERTSLSIQCSWTIGVTWIHLLFRGTTIRHTEAPHTSLLHSDVGWLCPERGGASCSGRQSLPPRWPAPFAFSSASKDFAGPDFAKRQRWSCPLKAMLFGDQVECDWQLPFAWHWQDVRPPRHPLIPLRASGPVKRRLCLMLPTTAMEMNTATGLAIAARSASSEAGLLDHQSNAASR